MNGCARTKAAGRISQSATKSLEVYSCPEQGEAAGFRFERVKVLRNHWVFPSDYLALKPQQPQRESFFEVPPALIEQHIRERGLQLSEPEYLHIFAPFDDPTR